MTGYTGDACDKCVAGYYEDSGECKKCLEGCATCSGADKCDTCPEGYTGDVCDACASGYHKVEDVCVKDVAPQSSSSQSSSKHIEPPKSSEAPSGLGVGAIVGIVIGALVVAAVIIVAIYCAATAGAKRGKIDPVIYEEDTEFVTMSVL